RLPTPVTAKNTIVGIRNQGATHTAGFRVEFDINAAAQTRYLAFVEATAIDTGIVADGNAHYFTMAIVGVNVAFFIDHVACGTIAATTFTADEPMFPGFSGVDASAAKFTDMYSGYIKPT